MSESKGRGGGGRGRGRGGRSHMGNRRHNRHNRGGHHGSKMKHDDRAPTGGPNSGHASTGGSHSGGNFENGNGPDHRAGGGSAAVPPPPGWTKGPSNGAATASEGSPFSFWCEVCEETLTMDVGGMAEHFSSPVHQLKLALKGKTMGKEEDAAFSGSNGASDGNSRSGANASQNNAGGHGPATTTESVLDALFGAAGQNQSVRGGMPPGFSPQLPQKPVPAGFQGQPGSGPPRAGTTPNPNIPEYNPFGTNYTHPFGLGGLNGFSPGLNGFGGPDGQFPARGQGANWQRQQPLNQVQPMMKPQPLQPGQPSTQQSQAQQQQYYQGLQNQSPGNPLLTSPFDRSRGGQFGNQAGQVMQVTAAMQGASLEPAGRPPVHPVSSERGSAPAGQANDTDRASDGNPAERRDSVASEKEPPRIKDEFCGPIDFSLRVPQKPSRDVAIRITREVMQKYEDLLPPSDEAKRRAGLVQHLQKVVSSKMQGSSIHTYGSSASGFSLKGGSDVDLCLEVDLERHGTKRHIVNRLAGLMRKNRMRDVTAIGKARVPVVKFYDSMSRLSCDICVNNHLALRNSQMLRDYSLLDSRLKPLVLIVKYWAKRREINEPYRGSLSSYCYTLMCIFHLQTRDPPILPRLQKIPDSESRERARRIKSGDIKTDEDLPDDMSTYCRKQMVDQWNVYSTKELDRLTTFGQKNTETVGELLCSFLGFFAHEFDRNHAVASIREGRLLSKDEIGWNTTEDRNRHLFCIEDPFDLSHDLGRVVDDDTIKELTDEFARGYKLLCEGASLEKVCEPWKG